MIDHQDYRFFLIFVFFLFVRCNYQEQKQNVAIPEHINGIENLAVFSPNDQAPDTVVLEKVAVFESNEDVFMEGDLSRFAVDDLNRVYIAATRPGNAGIYVFNPDGEYITRFINHGRGPGEYESINSIDIHDQQLYLLDLRLQKFGIFSLEDFSHIEDQVITRDKLGESDSLAMLLNLNQLFVTNENEYILKLRMIPRSRENASQKELYYRLDGMGEIEPGKLLELRGLTYYYPPSSELAVPFLMPFSRSKLVSVTKDGEFYTAWSDDFLINKYDRNGAYVRAIYYPVGNAQLSMDEIDVEKEIERALNRYPLSDTWPVLHTLEVDDEGRIWTAVITESKDTFQWWVLDTEGNSLARFTLPGRRSWRSAYSKPLMMIKDGFFYSHERDFKAGIDRIVKHKITFKQQ